MGIVSDIEFNSRGLDEIDFCVIDTETTGGSAVHNRVIDVAVFRIRDGIILEKYETLINPGVSIPAWITALTGIHDDMVKHAPFFHEIAAPLKNILSKGVFVAHNAPFDYRFIKEEYVRLGEDFTYPKLCTVRLARALYPELPSRSLGPLCEHLLIDIYDRHRAAGDAEATSYVLKHLLKKLSKDYKVKTWGELEKFFVPPPKKKPAAKKAALTRSGEIARIDGSGR